MQVLRPPAQVTSGRVLFDGEDVVGASRESCAGSVGGTSRWSSRAR